MGLKITMKIPDIIFENAAWAAKPIIATKIPAPAKRVIAKVLNWGIKEMMAPEIISQIIKSIL